MPKLELKQGGYSMRLTGFGQFDAGVINQDIMDYEPRRRFTRARAGLKGALAHDFDYFIQYDVGLEFHKWTHLYMGYNGFEHIKFRVGQFKEPFSMEMLTASKYDTFIARSVVQALVPKFSLGGQALMPFEKSVLTVGVFGGNINNFHTDENKHAITGRYTYTPILEKNRVLHFGIAGSSRWLNDETNKIRFKSKPEISFTSINAIDTKGIGDADQYHLGGLEFAYEHNNMGLQAQYVAGTIERDADNFTVHGGYIQTSYRLTGEKKVYKRMPGVFAAIKPETPVTKGGIGAWELATRYSHLDLDEANGGTLNNITTAVNWYPTDDVKLAVNASYGAAKRMDGTDNPMTLGLRLQLEF